VIILGRRPDQPRGNFIFVGIDFSNIFEKPCDTGDYEIWEPPFRTEDNKGCVLGHKLLFKRKKPNSICENGSPYDRVFNVTYCNCTKNDYECDYGFERTDSQRCVMEKGMSYRDIRSLECANGDATYVSTGGYRKIPGDKCKNDVPDFTPVVGSCRSFHFRTSWIFFIVFIVVIALLVGALAYLIYSIRKGKIPAFLNKIPYVVNYMPVKTIPDEEVNDLLSTLEDEEIEGQN